MTNRVESLQTVLREHTPEEIGQALAGHPGIVEQLKGAGMSPDGPSFRLPSPNALEGLLILVDEARKQVEDENVAYATMQLDNLRTTISEMKASLEKLNEPPAWVGDQTRVAAPMPLVVGHRGYDHDHDECIRRGNVEATIAQRVMLARELATRGYTLADSFRLAEEFGDAAKKYRTEKLAEAGLSVDPKNDVFMY